MTAESKTNKFRLNNNNDVKQFLTDILIGKKPN